MVIFFYFSPTSNHLHPLQVKNCDSNSRLVVDEDDNGKHGKVRLERVRTSLQHLPHQGSFLTIFLPHPRVKVSIVGSLRDREVACSASDRQGSNFESCVWRTVSSQSSHHPQEVFLAQFSLYVHKGGLKPDSFHFISSQYSILFDMHLCVLHGSKSPV